MRGKLLALLTSVACVAGFGGTGQAAPLFNECPAVGGDTGCAVLITFGAGGSKTTQFDPVQGPYDGSDDALVGVLNNSGATVSSITLSGSGNGGGLFAFDGDGLSAFVGTSFGPTGYEGPGTSFTAISTDRRTGTVLFTSGLADGQSLYFSLESSPQSIAAGGGLGVGTVPEPGTLALLGVGFGTLGVLRRRRQP